MASNSNEDLTFEELFNTPWFFGEITEEKARAILMEASKNDGKTVKIMIFKKAIGQNSLASMDLFIFWRASLILILLKTI